jgi:16S rRNA processing protein RimM
VIKAPHGVRGEVRVDPRSDVPGRFGVGATLACDGIGPLTITSVRGIPAEPIIGFAGYASRPEAEPLRGRFLRVSKDEARQSTSGSYLWADLVGLRAETPGGEPIGTVRDLIRAGETDVLVLERDGRAELLLPAIASVVRDVDVPGGRIVVVPQEEL